MAARRSLDETRERILDAGAEMMSEAGYSIDSANISLIDACRRAGLSTAGSGYKIWQTQGEFRKELIHHTLRVDSDRTAPSERLVGVVAEFDGEPTLDELIRIAGNENAEAVVGSEWYTRLLALWLAAATDEEMRGIQLDTQQALLSSLSDTFGGLLERYGRRMRPPFTLGHLTQAIAAQMNGLGYFLAYRDETGAAEILRPTGPDGEPRSWHLISCAVQALVEAFTEPVGGA